MLNQLSTIRTVPSTQSVMLARDSTETRSLEGFVTACVIANFDPHSGHVFEVTLVKL